MKSTLIDITGKLPDGLVELYSAVMQSAHFLGINVLVVGAMARDLVLVHGYGARISRGTRDVDFGVQVADWSGFTGLVNHLKGKNLTGDPYKAHRLYFTDSSGAPWELDVVPFGTIAGRDHTIKWPPDHSIQMTTLGFAEAYDNAIQVRIKRETQIHVASPAGLALLKLIAWLEREPIIRKKDAQDFAYLIKTYSKLPEVFDALYDEGYMASNEWDEDKAAAMKLGNDVGSIAIIESRNLLYQGLLTCEDKVNEFIGQMSDHSIETDLNRNLFKIFVLGFAKGSAIS